MMEKIMFKIEQEEGFKKFPYKCTENKFTIGYGRNLETNGITKEEAKILLVNDIDRIVNFILESTDLSVLFFSLNEEKKVVMFDMIYQLGIGGFRGFKKMIAAMKKADWEKAAEELLKSKYAIQTPNRAKRNAKIIGRK